MNGSAKFVIGKGDIDIKEGNVRRGDMRGEGNRGGGIERGEE